jgi:AcrR family transcriptional regulator
MPKESKPQKKVRIRNPVATRAKLLQATIELVAEKGAAALSLKEAANRANVSRGVAYLHFDDREQLLNEAKLWISEGLQNGVKLFKDKPIHDRTFHTTKLVLSHPEASKLMITDAMAGDDLHHRHPLYKLVVRLLKDLKESGQARADIDIEILTYIMFGSIASTLMLGVQRKGEDLDKLSERFANEWNRILREGIFVKRSLARAADTKARKRRKSRTAD